MNLRRIAATAGLTLSVALYAGVGAQAHSDGTPDAEGSSCDTWEVRGGHHDTNGVSQGDPNTVEVFNRGGHYIVRGPVGYVEVVGGQGFNRNGNQGGGVQGEVDPGVGGADADFNVQAFAGANSPNAEGAGCVSVADNKVGDTPAAPPGYES